MSDKPEDCIIIGKYIQCPECGEQYPIDSKNVFAAPKGSGGCKNYGTCPACGYSCCINKDELSLTLNYNG